MLLARLTSYITPKMLLASNFGISWSTFPKANSSYEDQLAAQLDVCATVTSEMDVLANQALRATLDTEQEQGPDFVVTILPNGWARFRLSHWPILQLISAQVSPASAAPPNWTTIPQTSLQTEHSGLPAYGTVVPSGSGPGPTAALIAPGYVTWGNGRKGYLVQVTSINGFPTAGMDQAVIVGQTTLHVDDITGWWDPFQSRGARGTVYDPPWREQFTVTAATADDQTNPYTGPGTLTIDAGFQFAHTPQVGSSLVPDQTILVTTMPTALLQAGYYLATHYGLIRGANAAVMQSSRPMTTNGAAGAMDWYNRAEEILKRFSRVF